MWLKLIYASIFAIALTLAQDGPVTTVDMKFGHAPVNHFYFKNSDSILLHESTSDKIWLSRDQGLSWDSVSQVPSDGQKVLIQHPFINQMAYVLMDSKRLFVTEDQGKNWRLVQLPEEPVQFSKEALKFNAARSTYLIYMAHKCSSETCSNEAYYSEDNGAKWTKMASDHNFQQCYWGLSTEQFQTLPTQAVFCTVSKVAGSSSSSENTQLAYTESYFSTNNLVVFDSFQNSGVIGVGSVNRFWVVAVKPAGTSDLDMYISVDGKQFFNAVFPLGVGLKEDAYTVLESSSQSLMVDIYTSREYNKEYGMLYRSDSSGRYFIKSLENTNRNSAGIVDYEKVQGVEGIVLANIVSNPKSLSGQYSEAKRIETRISFDDGSSWKLLTPPRVDSNGDAFKCISEVDSIPHEKCALHLHSMTSPHTKGYIFSDSGVPGVIIGIGSVGDYLSQFDESDTFLSTDGGLSWKMIRKGPHKYESADQGGVLALISAAEEATDTIYYSTDFGQSWKEKKLDAKVRAKSLVSDPASTSQKMLLLGSDSSNHDQYHVTLLDFTKVFSNKCQTGDFEMWRARSLNENAECLLGHYQDIQRRKKDAKCYVGREYTTPESQKTNCQCTAENFECDFGYITDKDNHGKCVESNSKNEVIKVPAGSCVGEAIQYDASSGYRKIPGDTCIGGVDLAKPVKKDCKNVDRSASVVSSATVLDSQIVAKFQFEDSEILLFQGANGLVWRSPDMGKTITKLQLDGKTVGDGFVITNIFLHDGDNQRVYIFTSQDKLYWSGDRGQSFSVITLPAPSNTLGSTLLDFHPTEKDWLLFIGGTKCPNCHNAVYASQDNGKTWSTELDTYVSKCVFSQDKEFKQVEKDAIFCSAYANKFGSQEIFNNAPFTPDGNRLMLYKYPNFGKGERKELAERVVQFYVYEQFLAIAVESDSRVKLFISVDGSTLAETQFPPNTAIDKNAFTIVQSKTGTVFLDVFQNMNINQEYGYLFSSNSNGTFYTLSLKNTNRNSAGLVDFEQVLSVDGTLIANVVTNIERVRQGDSKQVKTQISFDAGGHWEDMTQVKDTSGNLLKCPESSCLMNLHGRSEITWTGPIFSASSSVGLLMGVGNYGSRLLDYTQGNTYLTRDGGLYWTEVQKGPHIFEFGDSGGLIVMVSDSGLTDKLIYSIDDGVTWSTFKFYSQSIKVTSLFIDSAAKGDKFIIIGNEFDQVSGAQSSHFFSSIGNFLKSVFSRGLAQMKQVVINVDFSKAAPQSCKFNDDGSADFEKWNPAQSDCILGQEMTYWRRKTGSVCHIGSAKPEAATIKRICDCQDVDYECDTGFWKVDGKCTLSGVDFAEPPGCQKGSKYQGRSGYRKIAASKCSGKNEKLEASVERICSGNNPGGVVVIPPSDGKAGVETQNFDNGVDSITWFPKSTSAVLRDNSGLIWQTQNGGSSWARTEFQEKISVVTPNPYFKDRVYFMSSSSQVHFVSTDKGKTFSLFKTPAVPNTFKAPVLEFHAEEADWIIFVGNVDCPGSNCRTVAYYTPNNGLNWTELTNYVLDCEWARDALFKNVEKQVVFCSQYADRSGNMLKKYASSDLVVLQRSSNFFKYSQVIFANLVGFAISENFMVVAVMPEGDSSHLDFHMSLDGERFALAKFPPNADNSNRGFTVLESASGSIFLDMFKHSGYGTEWGTLFVSNFNGTYYSTALEGTNRSPEGFVDYERMLGVEGVALMNQVANRQGVALGERKQIHSLLTYNEGATWTAIKRPEFDIDGKSFACNSDADCSLHFHGYTERKRVKNEMSDEGAVGIMIGVGNVGKSLTNFEQSNTYLTRDAGHTWKEVIKGPHLFEFGDFGSVIVLVHSTDPVNYIWYSITEGASFQKFEFHPSTKIYADRFVTDPSGSSQIFMLIGRSASGSGGAVVKLDFSKMRSKQCVLDTSNQDKSDFEPWSVFDNNGSSCVFGHESQYYRRKTGRNCFIGSDFKNERKVVKNCACTKSDFECDAGFYRDEYNNCTPYAGKDVDVWSDCVDGTQYLSSGYRKHKLSTCEGGEKLGDPRSIQSCNWGVGSGRSRAGSAGSWAAAILIPMAILGSLGFCYYRFRVAPYRYSIRLPTSNVEASSRNVRSFRFKLPVVNKVADAVRDLFSGIYADFRARSGYRSVPLDEGDVNMDVYD